MQRNLTRIEIDQFDGVDRRIATYCYTLQELAANVPYYSSYYYRPSFFRYGGIKTSRKKITATHFGVKVSGVGSLSISMPYFVESNLNYEIKNFQKSEEEKRTNGIMREIDYFAGVLAKVGWYEKRLQIMSKSTTEELNSAIQLFINSCSAREIFNLNELSNKSGVYMLVLDKYNTCYVGQSVNCKRRILQHWSKSTYFTGTGIDMFRAFDTTRIFFCEVGTAQKNEIDEREHRLVESIPAHVTINELAGGTIDFLCANNYDLFKHKDR